MMYSSDDWLNEDKFRALPDLLSPREASQLLRVKYKTIYDWRYRPEKYKTPENLFHKFGGLKVRKEVLRQWWLNRNSIAV